MIEIRKVIKEDLAALKSLLDTLELFPSEMLDDMIADYLNNLESKDIWFTAAQDGNPVSIGFCAPEKLTDGTFNLYALGVSDKVQGQGLGQKMMAYIEKELVIKGHRILIVETSGSPEFEASRIFYEKLNFQKEATIRDFWEEGDDKVIYWKKLN